MTDFAKSKVYVKVNDRNCILRCDGGYTVQNIQDIEEWILIDEGVGDKYNLCQTHYFADGLCTVEGICLYKYENGKVIRRTEEEIAADIAAIPVPVSPPTTEERLSAIEDALCEMDAANAASIAALEDALCEIDAGGM